MIITQLSGGLGNQLFQYAAGKSLALERNTVLKCDTNFFDTQSIRSLDLQHFNVDCQQATETEIQELSPRSIIQKFSQRILSPHKRKVYREPFFHFDPNFYAARKEVYLKGNWQSEQYFLKHASNVRNDYTIKPEFIKKVIGIGEKMKKANSVSIHIRRGDYVLPHVYKYHGLLPKEYYQRAIETIANKVNNPELFLFSDDIEWVKNNLTLTLTYQFVSNEVSKTAIEDFYLMQCCQHNIIANSSFSWWAAWLNDNPLKVVIAPERWFNEGPKDTQDLLPKTWIKL